MKRTVTIGLEIHAELATHTKMFCDSLNDPNETRPNIHVCPVCLGHPGTLPTVNKKAVEQVIRVGLALGGTIAPLTKFDRKSYFYPDLPKGYQISQYDEPLVTGGEFRLKTTGETIRIRRIHLEEDTGRLIHIGEDSFVDFNRAGVPLMELVTEPDFRSAEAVVEFARYFQLLLRYLGASSADMEKGQMRVEANVSYDRGKKTELKNLNSFRTVADAVAYELKRQAETLDAGGELRQETRGWDEAKKKTFHQRIKEEAHDYRYFPEPDIPPFETSIFNPDELKIKLPELPREKAERFSREFGLSDAQIAILIEEPAFANFYENAESELAYRDQDETDMNHREKTRALLFNYLTSDLVGLIAAAKIPFAGVSAGGGSTAGGKVAPEHLAHLIDLVADGEIGSRQAKDILKKMLSSGADPESILEDEGLHTVSDTGELERVVKKIIAENQKAVEDYARGKTASVQFLVGQAMKELKGRGDPNTLKDLFIKHLTR